MKLVNKSSKAVFVGSTMLMPDGFIEVDESVVKTPGIQALLNIKPAVLVIDDAAEKAAKAKKAEDELRAQIAAEERAKIMAEMKAEADAKAKAEADAEEEAKADAEAKAKKEAAFMVLVMLMKSAGICEDDWEKEMWETIARSHEAN